MRIKSIATATAIVASAVAAGGGVADAHTGTHGPYRNKRVCLVAFAQHVSWYDPNPKTECFYVGFGTVGWFFVV